VTGQVTEQQKSPTGRPEDVDTGFWLWTAALVLMVIGYLIDALTGSGGGVQRSVTVVFSVMFLVVLSSIVAAFLMLMRQGYRWARTLLTSGGIVTVLHAISSLLTGERQDAAAVGYAVTAIVGSVLIAGGLYLLHRKDADGFFTR
jgi:O-antigen/teichoic acid export membrane protein